MKWYCVAGTRTPGTMPIPRQAASCALIVSMPAPLCSMSKTANSAPAARMICGIPGEKNSKVMAPKAWPPSASRCFTGLSRIAPLP